MLTSLHINPGHPEAASISADRRTLEELARVLRARESFVFETTLSSHQSVELMRAAKDADYEVGLVFVALNSANLNVQRVADRVARGGHHIPEDIIRRRYEAALRRLPEAIRLADSSMLFDNSTSSGAQLLMQIQAASIEVNNLDEADIFHCRLAEAVSDALSISTDAVFRAAKLG
jgi:predicted ABC-type ATPase